MAITKSDGASTPSGAAKLNNEGDRSRAYKNTTTSKREGTPCQGRKEDARSAGSEKRSREVARDLALRLLRFSAARQAWTAPEDWSWHGYAAGLVLRSIFGAT